MEPMKHDRGCTCVPCDIVREQRHLARHGAPQHRPQTGHTMPYPPREDPVKRPAHYTSDPSGVECIQIVRHRNFNVGNALKYLWRAGLKSSGNLAPLEKQVQDLEKARWYIDDEIGRLTRGADKGTTAPA